jgi:hypothetical protein
VAAFRNGIPVIEADLGESLMKRLPWIILAALLFVPALRADTVFDVTGTTDLARCASFDMTCPAMTFSFVFDTTRVPREMFGSVNQINSFGGTVNGMAITGSGGWLLDILPPGAGCAVCGTPFGSDVNFTLANGNTGYLFWDDFIFGGMVFSDTTNSEVTLITWNSSVVSTPEPGALVLLAFGLAGCTLLAAKYKLAR